MYPILLQYWNISSGSVYVVPSERFFTDVGKPENNKIM